MGFERSTKPWRCVINTFWMCACFSGRGQSIHLMVKGSHQPRKAEAQPDAMTSAQWQLWSVGRAGARTQASSLLSWGILFPTNCSPCGIFMPMSWSLNAEFLQLRRMVRQVYGFTGFCFQQTAIFCNGKIFLTCSGSIPFIHQPSVEMSSMPKQFSLK